MFVLVVILAVFLLTPNALCDANLPVKAVCYPTAIAIGSLLNFDAPAWGIGSETLSGGYYYAEETDD
jgi:hypothetical protein